MKEFYQKHLELHQTKANDYLMTDTKLWMFHMAEASNYKKMLDSVK